MGQHGVRQTCEACGKEAERRQSYVVEVTRGFRTDEEREVVLERDLCDTCYETLRESLGVLEHPAQTAAPAVRLCKDCRWRETTYDRVICQRPTPLQRPDYVFGETTTPRGIGCATERGHDDCVGAICGPSGKYWAAKEG